MGRYPADFKGMGPTKLQDFGDSGALCQPELIVQTCQITVKKWPEYSVNGRSSCSTLVYVRVCYLLPHPLC